MRQVAASPFITTLLLLVAIIGLACGGVEEKEEKIATPAATGEKTATPDVVQEETATPVPPTEVALATKTFSKYGFSFEYPKEFLVNEVGLLENEANDTSGVVQVGLIDEEIRLLMISWIKTVTLVGDYLGDSLDGGIQELEESEGIVSVDTGERVETDFEGQRVIYQFFTTTDDTGKEAHGLVAGFYCEDSQKLFSFNILTTIISTNQDILQDFETYSDSFVC